ncbi:CRISPR-associated endoribonuclease Cas6 [Pseudothermotoga sp.]
MVHIFYSLVIKLVAQQDGVYEFYPGRKMHALFLDLVRSHDESLSERLHQEKGEKSFTVSSFLGKDFRRNIVVRKNKFYFVRVTVLSDEVFEAFIASLFRKRVLKEQLRIGNVSFEIRAVMVDETKSKWASCVSSEQLWNEKEPERHVKIRFHTPTLFKTGDLCLCEPDPQKVFTSLLRKFNKYSEIKFREDLSEKFKQVKIAEQNTKLRTVSMDQITLTGFIGDVVFEVPENDEELLKAVNVLSSFAFYSGVGYKTTMGFGQAERLKLT